MCADSIDFANSKSDSYAASNSSVMDELNAYFKSYIAGHGEANSMTMDEAADEIFNGAGFDDAMDMINRDNAVNRIDSSDNEDPSGTQHNNIEMGNNDDDTVKQNLLDVEILDQHIDKAGINGGADATRAIENMAGGGPIREELDLFDEEDTPHESDMSAFANAMLGGSAKKPRINTSGPVRGYSGVTSEIRVKGNRVTERNRNGSNYLTEDGYVDMSMLGGGSDDEHGQNGYEDEPKQGGFEDEGYDKHGDFKPKDDGSGFPAEQGPAGEKSERLDINPEDNGPKIDTEISQIADEASSDSESYEETNDDHDIEHSSMASEIDHVLSQLRNKTARTLTGGTVNIRKKVVLTDMYPYIIRT